MTDAIEILRGTEPHPESPLPWTVHDMEVRACDGKTDVCGNCYPCDAEHIAAAVNAAPVLLAEIDRLRVQLAASEQARSADAMELLRCQSAMREWMVLSSKADDREVKARKDAEQLCAQLAAAREVMKTWPVLRWHAAYCASLERSLAKPVRPCDCGADAANDARHRVSRALGLEAPND